MPRKLTFRNILTALTVAVVSLWGSGKGTAESETHGMFAAASQQAGNVVYLDLPVGAQAEVSERTLSESAVPAPDSPDASRSTFAAGAAVSDGMCQASADQACHSGLFLRPPARGPPISFVL